MSQIIFVTDPVDVGIGTLVKWSKELDQFIKDREPLIEEIFEEKYWKHFPKGKILRVTGKLDINEGFEEFIFEESAIEVLPFPWEVE